MNTLPGLRIKSGWISVLYRMIEVKEDMIRGRFDVRNDIEMPSNIVRQEKTLNNYKNLV